MFKLWVENIRAPRLQELTPNQVYRTCYVCNIHFGEECLVPGTLRGLRKDAVPTLNLSVLSEDVEVYVQTEEDVGQQELLSLPSTSKLSADKVHEEHILQSTAKIAEESVQTDTAGTSKCPDSPSHDDSLLPSEMCRVMEHLRSVVESTSESSRGVRKRKSILKQVDVTRQAQLTPKCKQLYKMVGNWGQKTATLQHKMKSLKERLRDAEKVATCTNLTKLMTEVNETTYMFIMQQVRTQHQKPHARRFTMNEKILALSFLKTSGKAYRFLSKIFCLPSIRTLTNLLNEIPYGADHANVFMVKGIHRQWKQAVSFNFSSGPIKSQKLKPLLLEIIKECKQIGLEVVATVCDQGSANQAVINSLLKDTHNKCIENGVQNTFCGFTTDGTDDVIPLYDVPHLFKGIRNNLLTKDLHFEENGLKKIARWDHIKQFYMLDKMEDVRLCPKLTDGHILGDKMKKMKVSAMAQVFSYSVGSLMKRISQWGANCEKDFTVGALDDLRSFLTGEVIAGVSRLEPDVEVVLPDLPLHCKKSRVAKATLAYLAGYIAKTLLKKHGTCTTCRELLLRTHGDVPIEVIEARNFNQNRFLTQPGSFLYYVTSEAWKDQKFLYLTKHAPNKNLLDPVKLEAHEKYVKRRHLKKKH
ncbi:hypothetical protein GEV33_004247 [Tenebrio molitor]|uniref:THAP-type domain-containing protein n=1 Tax=Tenebrio molitor TaxID=7067 RepID=A0A8J6LDJ2_TENMO|nr:hypothetical protein GEV33_004247 [Tenebrio molitor]